MNMKNSNLLYLFTCVALMFSACDDFLDEMPDNRAEINSVEKVTSLLVSAYPTNTDIVMTEIASDNAMDSGSRYTVESQEHEDAYLWNDITGTGNDSPQSYWDACYNAIAAANQALQAIEDLGNPANLQPQKGEALLCRAYGHFALANVFCLAYNPETASTVMGIPYSESPETQVAPEYTRGTLEDLYAKINADIEEGLPLIDDAIYSVPKYHFNKKAAYAFATRFNLYYQKFDKVITYAEGVLGTLPEKVMRNWAAIGNAASNWDLRVDMYINASEPANLLLLPVYSSWGYWGGPYSIGTRYGHADAIFMNESVRAAGLWGSYGNLYPASAVWGLDQKLAVTKIGGYFHYTDKVNGIGYRMNVINAFSADETLLCRAEAYALNNQLDLAVADINVWLKSHTKNQIQVSLQDIVDFYSSKSYMPLVVADVKERTIKKEINPQGFTVAEGDQENVIQCILHLRRIETVHEGLRWQDIKRYGIEISHNREGLDADILKVDDPRRAIQLPQDVINAGLEANPRN